ncbi:hypothetical protein SANTM175S_01700 [Streptomyces antimycoticus]
MDQPSAAMWCTTSTSTKSPVTTDPASGVGRPVPEVNSVARRGGSLARSKACEHARSIRASSSSAATGTTGRSTPASATDKISWYGSPAASGKRVRRLSCRATTSPSDARNAELSNRPDNRSTSGMLYKALAPSSRSTNHNRRWA